MELRFKPGSNCKILFVPLIHSLERKGEREKKNVCTYIVLMMLHMDVWDYTITTCIPEVAMRESTTSGNWIQPKDIINI